jgi:hypothetical protein
LADRAHNNAMLDNTFKYSQHSLSDHCECPRRFYLKYVEKQAWPLVESNPSGLSPLEYQAYLWRGTVLHRWIERYWLGVPPLATDDAELNIWWARFTRESFDALPAQRIPELALVAPLGNYLLYARFDLLAFNPGSRAVIVDWKTLRGERPPRYSVFAERLQTRIYLYVLATASAAFNGGQAFAPEQCSMRYWLANFPAQPWVDVPYSADAYEHDKQTLLAMIERIAHATDAAQFGMAEVGQGCTYCTYRTLCQSQAAQPSPTGLPEMWVDIESVAEIDY